MSQIRDAYVVAVKRTPVGKAPRGMLKTVRPDDLLVYVIKAVLKGDFDDITQELNDVCLLYTSPSPRDS